MSMLTGAGGSHFQIFDYDIALDDKNSVLSNGGKNYGLRLKVEEFASQIGGFMPNATWLHPCHFVTCPLTAPDTEHWRWRVF